MQRHNQGFTTVEILVTIGVIGILSAVTVISYQGIRTKARVAAAQKDLFALRDAVRIMVKDTDAWPNGCVVGFIPIAPGTGSDNEVALDNNDAGLLVQPALNSGSSSAGDNCRWTQEKLNHWDGPYMNYNTTDQWGQPALLDPWKHPYYYDSDYHPYRHCSSHPNSQLPQTPEVNVMPVLYSMGPNGYGAPNVSGQYDCDNIHVALP